MMASLAWGPFKHSVVEFPWPDKIERLVHNDGDREAKLLSLSLRDYKYTCVFIDIRASHSCFVSFTFSLIFRTT